MGAPTHRQVHDFRDFQSVRLRKRSAEHGKILREHVDQAAFDQSVSGDEAVAGRALFLHAEIAAVVHHELVEFLEGAFIQQQFDSLARAQLAFLVLAFAPLGSAALLGFLIPAPQFFQPVVVFSQFGHRSIMKQKLSHLLYFCIVAAVKGPFHWKDETFMSHRLIREALIAIFGALTLFAPVSSFAGTQPCESLLSLKLPDTTITGATSVPAGPFNPVAAASPCARRPRRSSHSQNHGSAGLLQGAADRCAVGKN